MFNVDISEYNGVVNWPVAAPFLDLVMVKATGACGTGAGQILNNVDPLFNRNWCSLAGYPQITRGAYLFLYMSDDPKLAAKQFLDLVQPGPDDLVAVDLEDQETSIAIKGKGSGNLWPTVKTCLDALEAGIGKKPFIYTSAGWWNYYFCKVVPGKSITSPAWASDYPLWVANYTLAKAPLMPIGFKEWLIWQYASDKVPGCGVSVGSNPNTDLNRLSLSLADLKTRWNPAPVAVAPPVEPTLEQKVEILWKAYQAAHP